MDVSKCPLLQPFSEHFCRIPSYVVFTATQKSGDHALHVSDVGSYALDFWIHPKFHSRYQTPQTWCNFHCPASQSSAVLGPVLTNRAPGYGDASSSDKFSAYVWLYEEEYKNKIREPEEYRRCMQWPWNYLLFKHTVRVDGSRWRRMWAGEEFFVCLCQRRSCSLSLANIVFLILELVDLVPPSHLCLVSFSIVC